MNLCNSFFDRYRRSSASVSVITMCTLLRELVRLRDGYMLLDSGYQFTKSELQCMIDCVSYAC